MKIRTETIIKKSADVVWQIMGNNFAQIHSWASYFKDSKPSGEKKFDGIDFSAREVTVGDGKNTHSLDVFDSENFVLSYTVTAGKPPFADYAGAEWALEEIDDHSCKASITVNMELKELPTEKIKEISTWLEKSSEDMLDEMKHYAETGTLHERKLKSQG